MRSPWWAALLASLSTSFCALTRFAAGRPCRSIGVFLRDLTAMYNRDTSWPKPSIAYSDFAAWQRDWLSRPQAEAQRDWWKEQLKDAPSLLQLPSDYQRPSVPTGKGGSVHVQLDAGTTAAAKAFAREMGCTLYSLFLSVYRQAWRCCCGAACPPARFIHKAVGFL